MDTSADETLTPTTKTTAKPELPAARIRKKKRPEDAEKISITKQTSVRELITVTDVPSCWDIPRDYKEVAYLLDLRGCTEEQWKQWVAADGTSLSMAAIIKNEVRRTVKLIFNLIQVLTLSIVLCTIRTMTVGQEEVWDRSRRQCKY